MKKIESIRLAKLAMADGGVKIFQKDIKDVYIHRLNITDYVTHRRIYRVEMKDGRVFEVLQETVDKDGNFSMHSAAYKTQDIKEVKE